MIDCLKIQRLVIVDRPFRNPCCLLQIIRWKRGDMIFVTNFENNFGSIEILDIGR